MPHRNQQSFVLGEKDLTVVKRNGALVPFRRQRIQQALEAAFRDTKKVAKTASLASEQQSVVTAVTSAIVEQALASAASGACLTVEGIQDLTEVTLMQNGYHDVAHDYIIYRDNHQTRRQDAPQSLKIEREDGSIVRFNPMKIASSIERTFRRTLSGEETLAAEMIAAVNGITQQVVAGAVDRSKEKQLHVSDIQDAIEQQLMVRAFYRAAKEYILHRAHKAAPATPLPSQTISKEPLQPPRTFTIQGSDGSTDSLSEQELQEQLLFAARGLEEQIAVPEILEETIANFYDGMSSDDAEKALLFAARAKIEQEPAYARMTARLLCTRLYRHVLGATAQDPDLPAKQQAYFKRYIAHGVATKMLAPELEAAFDLDRLAAALQLQRDDQFLYLGLQTLYDRYFLQEKNRPIETAQILWMRVAMGMALAEKSARTEQAIRFYDLLSTFRYIAATPTLFNAGTCHPQLSSCYLSTVMDDLQHIFKVIADNAILSKWAGGLGNDWSNVRATGAKIKGTNGKSQGIVPFLKVANDTAVAVNQGGKRKGALCAYLETWHLDIEDFLELRKNTGDERRRTHDMNTANWIPDLFMKRVTENGKWTLFSPDQVPDLHHLYGKQFEQRYCAYEEQALQDKTLHYKRIDALQLWRKMLSMLFETGHPWITFKDPSNVRSPQDHAGVVHSSNLCTEILLNTSPQETAVCNLGSINLATHVTPEGLNQQQLQETVQTAIRMLDNVIDINFYPTMEAKTANTKHRAIGLGVMGFQDALHIQNISYASHEAIEFADASMEQIAHAAILASSQLAKERGPYASYRQSKWERGLLPLDTLRLLEKERGSSYCEFNYNSRLDWSAVYASIRQHGMRNCNTLAIAPTATIANIAGVTQSIEPTYKQLYVKSNLSGEFTILNPYLVARLQKEKLWDREMIDDLKYFDGSIQEIKRIPEEIKKVFLTAFEIEPEWLIECASRRQKWIDMGQSLNLYLAEASGKKLHQMYLLGWKKGLKTHYYLRSLGATQIEKSTTDINRRGLQPRWMKHASPSRTIQLQRPPETPRCSSQDGCESCQ